MYLLKHRREYSTGIIERGCGREADMARGGTIERGCGREADKGPHPRSIIPVLYERKRKAPLSYIGNEGPRTRSTKRARVSSQEYYMFQTATYIVLPLAI